MPFATVIRRCVVAFLALMGAALPAQVVLTFDDLALANYTPIPATYGDALDPNVTDIQYRTLYPDLITPLSDVLGFWNLDYGDLASVAYPEVNGYVGEISFVPAPGYGIRLISFDMAGYSHLDRVNTVLRIIDGAGNVVFDFAAAGQGAVEGDAIGLQHTTFMPNIAVAGTLRIQWGVDWDIGIDNIAFQGVPLASIPEPSTLGLLALGLSALVARRRLFARS